jgi:predicted metal-dependent phosphoesterase TrpH
MIVELHCHSTASDGSAAPEDVGRRAGALGAAVFALTDHDTTSGHAAIAAACPNALRAVELTCHDKGRAVHVLCYDVAGDERWAQLEEVLVAQASARRERLRTIATRLWQRGVRVDVEPLLARSHGRSVGRPDIAQALVDQGVVADRDEAFSRWLHDGGPGDVPLARHEVADGLALVRAGGGKASLAHPHQHGDRARSLLERHRHDGLAVEAFYRSYDPGERARWLKLADQLGVAATGGSDWHGGGEGHLGVDIPDERGARLLEWLGRA